MTAVSAIVARKQAWSYEVKYLAYDESFHTLNGTIFAETLNLVYRYFDRKFRRFAKEIESIDVADAGLKIQTEELYLRENAGTNTIEALKADGTILFTETPPFQTTLITPYGIGPRAQHQQSLFTPPTSSKREVFPALDTYAVFEKVYVPLNLADITPKANQFKAKFYEVFPREK